MKNIKEKQLLVKWAKALNEEVDTLIVKEVEEYERLQKEVAESLKQKPFIETIPVKTEEVVIKEEELEEIKQEVTKKADLISLVIDQISKDAIKEESFQQPDVPIVSGDLKEIKNKLKFLEQWLGKVSMAGPGGGEVRLKYLDDIDRASIGENKHLAYNATTDTFFFEAVISTSEIVDDGYTTEINGVDGNVISVINLPRNTPIGPIEQLSFNVNHTHQEVRVPGTLCWDPSDNTLNLTHPNDVVQQVGQESFMVVRNKTGNTILNGQVLRFDGAEMNGTARITAAPFLADGTYPSLYTLGVATSNIAANADGFATVFGKVRDIDTTGNTAGETWYTGNILYANPTIAGGLTIIKPTAPFNVTPIAAVLRVDATQGEIFVRPTIQQKQSYGRFARTTNVTVGTINTAANVVFDSTVISNGITLGTPASRLIVDQSGYYGITVSGQIEVGGGLFNQGIMYMWLRKNGTDVPLSMIRQAVTSTNTAQHIQKQFEISLNAGDEIEIMYAGDDTQLQFEATAATAFGPNTAAIFCTVTQLQL